MLLDADIVARALEAYQSVAARELAAVFYARLAGEYDSDLDLEAVIGEAAAAAGSITSQCSISNE